MNTHTEQMQPGLARVRTDGGRLWRSLDELADRPAFRDWMEREFPAAASELPSSLSRRRWLQLMGASLAFGGLAGCRWEAEEFAPLTVRPQNRIPGERQQFASSWELAGVARPLTVTSIDGRPLKIEGNTEHPGSEGGTDVFDQALILSLYDPDRSRGPVESAHPEVQARSWSEFEDTMRERLRRHRSDQGRGLAILTHASSSVTRRHLQQQLREQFPEMMWSEHEPAQLHGEREGVRLAFGNNLRPQYAIHAARVIACFDADPLGMHPAALRSIRDWSARRDPDGPWMNRTYAFESGLSLTGSNADHRIPLKSAEIPGLIVKLEQRLAAALDEGRPVQTSSDNGGADATPADRTLAALVDDLIHSRGQSILMAGPQQPPEVHARIQRLNVLLDNVGRTVEYVDHEDVDSHSAAIGLEPLITKLEAGEIDTLIIVDVNPAYGSAASPRFREAIARVPFSVHAGLYRDETSQLCRWHVPLAHPLESWADARTWDGTLTLAQPLIAPLFNGRSACEILALLADRPTREGRLLVREALRNAPQCRLTNERDWRRAVHAGFVRDSSFARSPVELAAKLEERVPLGELGAAERDAERELDRAGYELVLSVDRSSFDGRFANNGWLQELPDAITKLTWDNAAIIGPGTADSLGVSHGDLLRIRVDDCQVELPAFVLPGVATGSIQLSLGYGRTHAGHVGGLSDEVPPVGVDVSVLLQNDRDLVLQADAVDRVSGSRRELATTQDHFAIDTVGLQAISERLGELVRTGTIDEYREHGAVGSQHESHHPALESPWEERSYDGHAWGMAIDLNRCVGCNACTVACQSENNVPIVGREQVLGGREMHWLRVDRYFSGDPEEPEVAHQPVACHHCENAPCEQVCPVAATVHSDEGLNDMVYNRCIGTRYCANNCPYKVRRFNFFDYNKQLTEPGNELTQLILNPDVTVRSRGVMEKCTYCVQRIQAVKIDAKNERRGIADGEIQTACQQACPANAIVFGDLNDPDSAVARAHSDGRAYGMLAELNTKPRTRYLARIRNPHRWLASTNSAHT